MSRSSSSHMHFVKFYTEYSRCRSYQVGDTLHPFTHAAMQLRHPTGLITVLLKFLLVPSCRFCKDVIMCFDGCLECYRAHLPVGSCITAVAHQQCCDSNALYLLIWRLLFTFPIIRLRDRSIMSITVSAKWSCPLSKIFGLPSILF